MTQVINSFLGVLSPAYLWQPLLILLPLILIIFGLAFGINLIDSLISSRRSAMIRSFMSEGGLHIKEDDDYYKALSDDDFYERL